MRVLDGLPWSLRADELWEAWVESVCGQLAQRLGGRLIPRSDTRTRLRWRTRLSSLESLEPDVGIRLKDRQIWFDAKYKFHLQQVKQRGWRESGEKTRKAHRHDVHQALAYASLSDAEHTDTVLAYPLTSQETVVAVSDVPGSRRAIRLILVGVPFGLHSTQRSGVLDRLEQVFREDAC